MDLSYFISEEAEVHPFLANTSHKVLRKVHAILSNMQEGDVEYKNLGICFNLEDKFYYGKRYREDMMRFDCYKFMYEVSQTWTLFSGKGHFPIPSDKNGNSVYKWEGQALEERNSLLSHLMLELEKAMGND